MGRRERAKGVRRERQLVRRLRAAGLRARRVPLSGAAGGERCDVLVEKPMLRIELKSRASGWQRIRRWLNGADALVLWADRCEPVVVMRLSTFEKLAKPEESHG